MEHATSPLGEKNLDDFFDQQPKPIRIHKTQQECISCES